jgi:hypothetical protein
MKHLFLIVFFLPLFSFGQYDQDKYSQILWMMPTVKYGWYQWDPNSFYGGKDLRTSGIDTLKNHYIRKNGKSEMIRMNIYNRDGRIVSAISGKRRTDYSYSDSLLVEITTTSPKNRTKKVTYQYNEQGDLATSSEFTDGKLTDQYRFGYAGNICTLGEHISLSGRKKHVYVMKKEVSAEGKVLKAIYLKDGEIERTWDYSCSDRGTVVEEKKDDETNVCKYEQQNNDGSYILYTRTLYKGKPYLTEVSYNADSVMTSWREFSSDSIMVRENIYSAQLEQFNRYTKKGKYKYGFAYVLDDQKRKTEVRSLNKKGKVISFSTFSYNDKGLITERNMNYGHGRKWDKEIFEYIFY